VVAGRLGGRRGVDIHAAGGKVTAEEALAILLEGNERYAAGHAEGPGRDDGRRTQQAEGQTPFAVILGCADSRVPPEIVFDQGIGDLFVIRVAGNTGVDDMTLGSLEFAVSALHIPLLVVLGHSECGGVKAAVDVVVERTGVYGHLVHLVRPIIPAVEAAQASQPEDLVDAAVKENVRRQAASLTQTFPSTTIVGAQYDLHSGRVELVSR
jgi:carbonic anhydrase